MSATLSREDTLHWQRLYSCAGVYTGELDEIWGPKTDAASKAWDKAYDELLDRHFYQDNRTEKFLHGVLPKTQALVRQLLDILKGGSLDARVVSGTRSYAQQNELFRQGRFGDKRPKVTKARGGQSNHNFGIAVDIGIFENGKYLKGETDREVEMYKRAGGLSKGVVGLEWGGDWKSFVDLPHYQVETGLSLSEVRVRFETGKLQL